MLAKTFVLVIGLLASAQSMAAANMPDLEPLHRFIEYLESLSLAWGLGHRGLFDLLMFFWFVIVVWWFRWWMKKIEALIMGR
jgi:hypothetical protein